MSFTSLQLRGYPWEHQAEGDKATVMDLPNFFAAFRHWSQVMFAPKNFFHPPCVCGILGFCWFWAKEWKFLSNKDIWCTFWERQEDLVLPSVLQYICTYVCTLLTTLSPFAFDVLPWNLQWLFISIHGPLGVIIHHDQNCKMAAKRTFACFCEIYEQYLHFRLLIWLETFRG